MILNHNTIWSAIDNLARAKHITPSRMAILSNMDSTSFNKSKRTDSYGRPHWPSVETLAKVFDAMEITWAEFAEYFPKESDAAINIGK